ncbi:hypothetical protein UFOVP450_195 [uncultured Caudovirales phage]|uniref:Uncharacterized protein n=1 Tax=uncultured Caudovirales phage TaxID=2100421 RepID=A0A6J5MEY0_9CAUD|nr:hypothetical protein UFOVP450_195 [uncultured Caudovirales phage]
MELYSIDLSIAEIQLMRQALDVITITGKDAKFVANTQIKLEQELRLIAEMQQQHELQKQAELQQLILAEEKKAKKQ